MHRHKRRRSIPGRILRPISKAMAAHYGRMAIIGNAAKRMTAIIIAAEQARNEKHLTNGCATASADAGINI